MPILQSSIDEATYKALDWQKFSGSPKERHYQWSLATRFWHRAQELEQAGQEFQAHAMYLLGGAISMRLQHSLRAPFGPSFRMDGRRSLSLDDLGEHDVAMLGRAARDASNSWLRARFADLAVSAAGRTPHDWRLGQLAVEAYLDYVGSVFGTEWAIDGIDELRRGLVLLRVYAKRDESLWDRYWALILQEVPHAIEKDWPGLVFRLCDEARHRSKIACEAILPQIKAKAAALESAEPQQAARWFDQAHQLHQRLGHLVEANDALLAKGEAMARAAALAAEQQPVLAPQLLTEAIGLLRQAKAQPSRIAELRDLLASYERASLDHYGHYEYGTDVSDWVQWIDEQIAAPDFFSALLRMAYRAGRWLDMEKIEERVRTNAIKYPLSNMFSSTRADASGMIVGQCPPLDLDDPASIRQQMVSDAAQFDIHLRSSVMVSRATDSLYTTYQPSFTTIKEVVEASVLTPRGQSESLARGLYAGFLDDWVAASAYLIPAVEPLVRAHLKRFGAHTTALNEDGTQHEKTLGELLDMPEAERYFGKNLIFEFQVLLIEQKGFNLRNAFCHGLMSDQELRNAGIMALWWALWRIVLFPWHDSPAVLAGSKDPRCPDIG